jgi:PhnB protein
VAREPFDRFVSHGNHQRRKEGSPEKPYRPSPWKSPVVFTNLEALVPLIERAAKSGVQQDHTPLVPPGWPRVVPRNFSRDSEGPVRFIQAVFGIGGEYRESVPSELWIGDSIIMVSGTEARAAAPAVLYVYVSDVDAVFRRAVDLGADAIEEPFDTPYGDRRGTVRDPWGNTWQIATWLGKGDESG